MTLTVANSSTLPSMSRSRGWRADIKIDHFIKVYYDSLLPTAQRASWAVFESPAGQPWSHGGVTAAHSNDCNCNCTHVEQCVRDGKAPLIWANGLVAQHNCRNAIDRLSAWQKVTALLESHPDSHCLLSGGNVASPAMMCYPDGHAS